MKSDKHNSLHHECLRLMIENRYNILLAEDIMKDLILDKYSIKKMKELYFLLSKAVEFMDTIKDSKSCDADMETYFIIQKKLNKDRNNYFKIISMSRLEYNMFRFKKMS